MRQRYPLILVGLVVAVLALGALPAMLQSGEPYHVTATAVETDHPTVNGSALSDRRHPYTTAALSDGRSGSYYEGPFGLKESFAHSPFDEFGELEAHSPEAVEEDTVYVRRNGTTYRLAITRGDDA
ncbi:hypothetical protein [Haloarchaeobius sp. DFWS5]|uniref:hypothetical protein n=1 Tax=Haloarchaeobius sp. DFWS5 TaxID=3446114 RepID=UPI003EBB5B7F